MFDKRKEPRKKLMAFTPVYTLHPKTLLGYLEDLTLRGARVVGDVPLEADKHVTLMIEFPKDTASLPPEPFTIQARVARGRQGRNPLRKPRLRICGCDR
ncbi:MAG: hypothetical protein HYZ24_06010 [Chloroflexi bacterium]|nr:hypothetical protein [Chloroflexota bacterium]